MKEEPKCKKTEVIWGGLVIQGHWQHHRSIERIWLSVHPSQKLCRPIYIVSFSRRSELFVKSRYFLYPTCIWLPSLRWPKWNFTNTLLSKNSVCGLQCGVVMATLHNRFGHYILPCGVFFFLLLFFFPRLISAVAEWMSAILLHMVWP